MPSVVVIEKVMSGTEAERILVELQRVAEDRGVTTDRRTAVLELHWDIDDAEALEATEQLLAGVSDTWSVHVTLRRPN